VKREMEKERRGVVNVKLDESDGRDEAEIAGAGRGRLETGTSLECSAKLVPPCPGFPAAAVPNSGEVGVRAPSARGPQVTAGPKDVVQGAGKVEGVS